MDLASGYSDNSANPFGFVNNAVAANQGAGQLANMNANLAYVGGQNQAALDRNFANFGQQTDYYSGLGAAFGRETGGFGGYGGGNDIYGTPNPSGQVDYGGPMPGYQLDPTPGVGGGASYYGGDGGWTNNGVSFDPYGNPIMGGNANQTGSSGRNNLANLLWQATNSNNFNVPLDAGGSSNAPPYQGNPFYMPGPMAPQQGIQQGGGFGPSGFGIGDSRYTGQPGFGLGIGATGGPMNMPGVPGTTGKQFGGQADYGAGGFPGSLGQDLMGPQYNQFNSQPSSSWTNAGVSFDPYGNPLTGR